MNLILSDVEETIMIVDVPEGASSAQGTVNVRAALLISINCSSPGHRLLKERWRCSLYEETE